MNHWHFKSPKFLSWSTSASLWRSRKRPVQCKRFSSFLNTWLSQGHQKMYVRLNINMNNPVIKAIPAVSFIWYLFFVVIQFSKFIFQSLKQLLFCWFVLSVSRTEMTLCTGCHCKMRSQPLKTYFYGMNLNREVTLLGQSAQFLLSFMSFRLCYPVQKIIGWEMISNTKLTK